MISRRNTAHTTQQNIEHDINDVVLTQRQIRPSPQISQKWQGSRYSNKADIFFVGRLRLKRMIAFVAPTTTLFVIVALWGLIAVQQKNVDSANITSVFLLLTPVIVGLSVIAIPVGVVFGIRYSKQIATLCTSDNTDRLTGVGGWLIFLALGLVTTILFQCYGILETLFLFASPIVSDLTSPESAAYTSDFTIYMWITVVAAFVVATAAAYLLIAMYQNRKTFPRYYIIFVWCLFVITILDSLYSRIVLSIAGPETYTRVVGALVVALVWGTYVSVSARVKNTFVA